MKTPSKLLLSLVFLTCTFTAAFAQNKKRVSFDSGDRIYVLDKKLNAQLQLFQNADNFSKASIFQLADTVYQLEIQLEGESKQVSKISENQYYQMQVKLDRYLLAETKREGETRHENPAKIDDEDPHWMDDREEVADGRKYFVNSVRGLALFGYGWMIPMGLQVKGATGFFGGYFMVAGGAIIFPYIFTSKDTIPYMVSSLYAGASVLGMGHGLLLHGSFFDEIDSKALLTMSATSIAEGVIMYNIAKNRNFSIGQAELMVVNSVYSGLAGGSLLIYANAFDKNYSRIAYASTAAISLGGYYVGYGLSKLSNYTIGNAHVFGTVVPLAMYTTASFFFAQSNPDFKTMFGLEALTYAGAVYIGHQLVKNKQFISSQGSLIGGATIGGGLFMTGLGLLLNDRSSTKDFSSTPLLAAAGAIAGFGIAYSIESNRIVSHASKSTADLNMGLSSISYTDPISNKFQIAPAMRLALKF